VASPNSNPYRVIWIGCNECCFRKQFVEKEMKDFIYLSLLDSIEK